MARIYALRDACSGNFSEHYDRTLEQLGRPDVRVWPLTDIPMRSADVRFGG
jgi:hypothetical protein